MGNTLKETIAEAFSIAIKEKSNISSNTIRSAKFVEEVVKGIFYKHLTSEQQNKYIKHVQKVKKDGSGKERGEWLLDGVICEKIEITDHIKNTSTSKIVKKLLWAIESESATSMTAMTEDFGKLIVVKSENYLYLNGLNQHQDNVSEYILRRIRTIDDIINKMDNGFHEGKLYYGFWPTPGKAQGLKSYWDSDDKDNLLRMIHLFEYKNSSFTEL